MWSVGITVMYKFRIMVESSQVDSWYHVDSGNNNNNNSNNNSSSNARCDCDVAELRRKSVERLR